MPSTYAHYVFGREILQRYPEPVRKLAEENPELFQIGLHGPDILFYYKALTDNPVNRIGFSMHERPAEEFFHRGADVVRGMADDIVKRQGVAYLLGFLCHFVLDSTCHGYIEKKIHVSGLSHTEIEVEFDRALLIRDNKDPVRQSLIGHIRPDAQKAAVISLFFDGVSSKQVFRSLRSMIRYNGLLVAPQGWKRGMILLILKLTGNYKEMHGLLVGRQPHPLCADSNLRLAGLMERALRQCLKLTKNYLEYLEGGVALDPWFSRTFSAGPDWRRISLNPSEEEQNDEA